MSIEPRPDDTEHVEPFHCNVDPCCGCCGVPLTDTDSIHAEPLANRCGRCLAEDLAMQRERGTGLRFERQGRDEARYAAMERERRRMT